MAVPLRYVPDPDIRFNFDQISPRLEQPAPQARVFNDADIVHATSGTPQALTFNSEHWDEGNLHSTSVNTSRLTAPLTGLYAMGGCIRFAPNLTGFRAMYLIVNGTTTVAGLTVPTIGNLAAHDLSVHGEWRLEAGDYVELFANQGSGGALTMIFSAGLSPEFWMSRIAGFTSGSFT